MILTVTPNTGIDYTLAVPAFQLNQTIRSSASAWGMGGKASDAAWILGNLGVPVMALGFAGGLTGEKMERMLGERGVTTDFIWVDGETRLNIVLVCTDGSGQSTFTSSGLIVPAGYQDELIRRYLVALQKATCIILGGTLPEGVPNELYPQMISFARRQGIPVIFDASGPALRAGIEARPSLVKPNLEELSQLLGLSPRNTNEAYRAAKQLQREYATDVILTMGGEDSVAVFGERAYQVSTLPVAVSSTAGAGDAVLAGMALAIYRQEPFENGLRYGFALAGAVLQTLATADFRVEDYQKFLPQITLIPYQENAS